MRYKLLLVLLLACIMLGATEPSDNVLAEFNGGQFTKEYLDMRISKLPPQIQGRYKTTDGQKDFLHNLCLENVWYMEALRQGYDKDSTVVKVLQQRIPSYYISTYSTDKINTSVSDAEKQAYYDEHKQDFLTPIRSSIFYIGADSDSLAAVIKAALDEGKDPTEVLTSYSSNRYAVQQGGKLENIMHGGYIRGIGKDPELDSLIVSAPLNQMQGPVKTKTGIHFFKVTDRTPATYRTLDQVSQDITTRLQAKKQEEGQTKLLADLKKKYGLTYNAALLDSIGVIQKDSKEDKDAPGAAFWTRHAKDALISSSKKLFTYTVKDLQDDLKALSPQEQAQYKKAGYLRRWVDGTLDNEVIYQAALKEGYTAKVEGLEEVQQLKRSMLTRRILEKDVRDKVTVTDEELQKYYNDNITQYTTPAYRKIQQLVYATQEQADSVRAEITKAARKPKMLFFSRPATKEEYEARIAELLKTSLRSDNNGEIDHIYQNGIIPGLGKDETFNNMVWNTQGDEFSPVFTNSQGQFVTFRFVAETSATAEDFATAKIRVDQTVHNNKAKELFDNRCVELTQQYNLKEYPERLETKLTAKELFDLAAEAQKNHKVSDAAFYYDSIIKEYANGNDDYKATFMKGFLYSEEAKDNDKALQIFEDMLKKYPEGELHESARQMINFIKTGDIPVELKD